MSSSAKMSIASENSDERGGKGTRKQTKFGMIMSSVGRSAKQGMSRAGKQMAKGVVKAKQAAVEKIGKVPITPEDPEIVSALERLKITKTEIYAISDIVRNLYEARVNEATFMLQMADKMKATNVSQNDPFAAYVQKMGLGLSSLESVQHEHLQKMEEELVKPLENFRDVDVETVQRLKLKYKNGKRQYDVAAHSLTKAQEGNDQAKLGQAQQKKDTALSNLTSLRNDMKHQVDELEKKKQVELLGCMESYWQSYTSFASATSNILSQRSIEKGVYSVPDPAVAMPAFSVEPAAGHEMEMKNGNSSHSNGLPAPNNNNSGDFTPSVPDDAAQGMPPPNFMDDDQYEYYDENAPQQSDDYNPFT